MSQTLTATLGLLGILAAGTATAQVESTAPSTTCAKPTYLLQISPDLKRTPMTVTLNNRAIDLGDGGAYKKDVTAQMAAQNRVQVNWTPKVVSQFGTMYDIPMTLKVLYGSRATTLMQFNAAKYPNQRQLAIKFRVPPAKNIACSANAYTANLAFSNSFGPFEWTIAVNGNYYVYVLGDAEIDLRPFLTKGANKVTLNWRVIGGNGRNNLVGNKVGQVTSTMNGTTKGLLTFGFKNIVGSTGSKSVTITVP